MMCESFRSSQPGVIVPKDLIDETDSMNHDPRPHIHRRGHAIGRLRSLTTGAAVAGLAGTAGFGVLAAATWSGNAVAADANGGGAPTYNDLGAGNGTTGTSGISGTNRIRIVPNTGGTTQQPTTTTPRVQRVTGTGHASTGGSH